MWGRDRVENTNHFSRDDEEAKSDILLIKVFKLQLRCLIIWSCWRRINEAAQLPSGSDSDAMCEYAYTQVCVCVEWECYQSRGEERIRRLHKLLYIWKPSMKKKTRLEWMRDTLILSYKLVLQVQMYKRIYLTWGHIVNWKKLPYLQWSHMFNLAQIFTTNALPGITLPGIWVSSWGPYTC